MPSAVLIAVLVHAIVILGLGFTVHEATRSTPPSMEVVFFDEATEPPPDDVALLSNVDHRSDDPDSQASLGLPVPTPSTSPLPMPIDAATNAPAEPRPAEPRPADEDRSPPEPPPPRSDPQPRPESRPDERPAPRAAPPEPATAVARPDVGAMMRQGLSQARDAASEGLRRQGSAQVLSAASARSVTESAYLENWTRRVETIGNLNYPEEARRRGLSGQLVVAARVRADGSLVDVHIQQSSGEPILDQAALDIVRLAAPFQAFPDAMRAEHDEILIVRAWNFRRDRVF